MIDQVAGAVQMAQHGSPVLLNAIGRVFGLGQDEQTALLGGRVPGWLLLAVGLAAGILGGAALERRDMLPKWAKVF